MPRSHSTLLAAALLLALPIALLPRPAAAEVPSPTVEGPVSGGLGEPFIASTTFDLAEVGYRQAEFFVSGTARSYVPVEPLESDGRWVVEPDASADYRTRILVYRPVKRGRFNGTVLVEWLNVTGGLDSAPDWLMTHTELIRRGYAWVGVSTQLVGVEGGPALPGLPSSPLKEVDPERYGSLIHPGDSFSYDIFSQVGEAVLHPTGVAPLGGLRPKRIIAIGESQSAFRLTTYVNAIQPRDRVYDGFFIHSRGASSAPLSQPPQANVLAPAPVFQRTDLGTPVLTFETETDLTLLNYARDRQPDSEGFRLWEVAGTAHADTYTTAVGATDLGNDPSVTELLVTTMPVPQIPALACPVPINSGPQHFVAKAAIAALERWVRTGRPPAPRPRIELAQPPPRAVIARDDLGNALGGIRTPYVDLPIAALSGQGQTGSILCILFGTTEPFDEQTLEALYPDACEYLRDFDRATWRAVRKRDVLLRDAWLIHIGARLSGPGADARCGRRHAGRKRLGGRHRGRKQFGGPHRGE
jgi:hypothetical protein